MRRNGDRAMPTKRPDILTVYIVTVDGRYILLPMLLKNAACTSRNRRRKHELQHELEWNEYSSLVYIRQQFHSWAQWIYTVQLKGFLCALSVNLEPTIGKNYEWSTKMSKLLREKRVRRVRARLQKSRYDQEMGILIRSHRKNAFHAQLKFLKIPILTFVARYECCMHANANVLQIFVWLESIL